MNEHTIEKLKNDVIDGYENPLTAWIQLHDLKKAIESAMEEIRDCAINECEKHPKSVAEINGRRASILYTTRYNYSENEKYAALQVQTKELAEKLKMGYYDEETGQGVPPVSKSVSVSVKISK